MLVAADGTVCVSAPNADIFVPVPSNHAHLPHSNLMHPALNRAWNGASTPPPAWTTPSRIGLPMAAAPKQRRPPSCSCCATCLSMLGLFSQGHSHGMLLVCTQFSVVWWDMPVRCALHRVSVLLRQQQCCLSAVRHRTGVLQMPGWQWQLTAGQCLVDSASLPGQEHVASQASAVLLAGTQACDRFADSTVLCASVTTLSQHTPALLVCTSTHPCIA